MPITMVIWFSDTNLPRMAEGDTSAMYIGESPEAMPMPIPPKKRATRKAPKALNPPVIRAETKKMTAETMSSFLRPIWSASQPQVQAPIIQPIRAMDMASPCSLTESEIPKYSS